MRSICSVLLRSLRISAGSPTRLAYGLAATAIALTFIGCGRPIGDRGELYPAEGQVLLNTAPLAGALVVLYPQGLPDAKAIPSRAQTGPDGRFRVSTFGTADGAPNGEYAVTVVQYPWQQDGSGWVAGPNALPAKYASPKTTDLRVQIGPDKDKLPALVLASSGALRGNGQASHYYQSR
jgi:hypothetical protein